ncbi:carboxypeptidase [Catenulispora acidiphila DSM 44928]|uniref:Carboxypeptidase n=1 Tax=Catenulispora acidiphila (strain DSM 44928 / JCM 14897 / NBRC 102108 / NRRL B-24433 / ID139908) TaxID=479433 RepID=C7Q8Z9_CATAD|nr:hypothetical protein [Catenulispora acidiphila]ACU72319.1 carboxypeptidase [Catenulispora acidiphila DSM 44928]
MSPTSTTRHDKPKGARSGGARRALVAAVTVPITAAVLFGQGTAFAAENAENAGGATTATAANRPLDAADQQIAKNLDARVQDSRGTSWAASTASR